MATHKSMLEEPWKNIKMLPITQKKKHSIIPAKDGKFKAAEVSAGTFKEYTFLQMLMLQNHPKMPMSVPVCKFTQPNCHLLCLFKPSWSVGHC